MTENKKWYKSKTLWLNTIGIIVIVIQSQTSFVIDSATQAGALALINMAVRSITNEGLK